MFDIRNNTKYGTCPTNSALRKKIELRFYIIILLIIGMLYLSIFMTTTQASTTLISPTGQQTDSDLIEVNGFLFSRSRVLKELAGKLIPTRTILSGEVGESLDIQLFYGTGENFVNVSEYVKVTSDDTPANYENGKITFLEPGNGILLFYYNTKVAPVFYEILEPYVEPEPEVELPEPEIPETPETPTIPTNPTPDTPPVIPEIPEPDFDIGDLILEEPGVPYNSRFSVRFVDKNDLPIANLRIRLSDRTGIDYLTNEQGVLILRELPREKFDMYLIKGTTKKTGIKIADLIVGNNIEIQPSINAVSVSLDKELYTIKINASATQLR